MYNLDAHLQYVILCALIKVFLLIEKCMKMLYNYFFFILCSLQLSSDYLFFTKNYKLSIFFGNMIQGILFCRHQSSPAINVSWHGTIQPIR